jgi:hypothetical protein
MVEQLKLHDFDFAGFVELERPWTSREGVWLSGFVTVGLETKPRHALRIVPSGTIIPILKICPARISTPSVSFRRPESNESAGESS